MYPIPPSETLVETKTCRHCSALFPITDKDMEFYEKVSPVFSLSMRGRSEVTGGLVAEVKHGEERELIGSNPPNPLSQGGESHSSHPTSREGVKIEGDKIHYLIPTPTLCPDCRQQRRLSFRNERKLYKRKCDATDKDIISIYSPDKPFKVYHQDYWWSDKWDPMEYGREFDFGKGFFEQFGEMMQEVPQLNLLNVNGENSEFCNCTSYMHNSYMNYDSSHNEDSLFLGCSTYCNDSVDGYCISKCVNCYNLVDCEKCYNVSYAIKSSECRDSSFLSNCIGCSDCMLCSNLCNKRFYFNNKEYPKKEFDMLKTEFLSKQNGWNTFSDKFSQTGFHKNLNIINCNDSIGDNLFNSNACMFSYDSTHCENAKHGLSISETKDVIDISHTMNGSLSLEVMASVDISRTCFSLYPAGGSNNYYCNLTINSHNLFACIGLRNKQYCILNKQYTREEYEAFVPKIIEHMQKTGEWGEFFPSSLSPFGYNETVAMEYYPLTREEVLKTPLEKGGGDGGAGGLVAEMKHGKERGLIGPNPPSPLSQGGTGGTFQHGPVFHWSDYEAPFPKVEKIIPADKLPTGYTRYSRRYTQLGNRVGSNQETFQDNKTRTGILQKA